MSSPPLSQWATAFALTVAIELPLYGLLLRRPLGVRAAVGVGLGVNLVTHPALWYLMPRFSPYSLWLAVSEGLVVAVEAALIIAALRRAREAHGDRAAQSTPTTGASIGLALLAALLANAVSTAVGLALLR